MQTSERIQMPTRLRLPDTRTGVNHQVQIGEKIMILRLNDHPYTNGPGEIFIEVDKEGSTVGGLLNIIGTLLSILFQIKDLDLAPILEKLRRSRFEPAGFAKFEDDEEAADLDRIRNCHSLVDYIAAYIQRRYNLGQESTNNESVQTDLPVLQSADVTDVR